MKKQPVILAIETSLQNGSLSIYLGENQIASYAGGSNDGPRRKVGRSEELLEILSGLLKENNLQQKDLDLIAVSVGPGSFTGIRVGVATAQALAFALNRPCFGVPILEALAKAAADTGYNTKEYKKTGDIITVVPSGRDGIFWQIFSRKGEGRDVKPQAGTMEDLFQIVGTGDLEHPTIIFEPGIFKKVETDFRELSKREAIILCASDNASEYIALFSFDLFSKPDFISSPLKAQYLLEVEIGKPK